MQPAGTMSFRGGTTSGEEITVLFDTEAQTYQIAIDASRVAARRGTLRKGRLLRGDRDCAYLLSGEKLASGPAPAGFSAHGVLLGRLAGAEAGSAPVAFIAFRQTSNRLADLAGRWRVSGRERAIDAALPSKPIAGYELRVRPDGRVETCASGPHEQGRHCSVSGRFSRDGAAFRLLDDAPAKGAAGDSSLILGKVGDSFMPILLKRDASGEGLRIFTPRDGGAR